MDDKIKQIKEYYTSIQDNRIEIANNKALIALDKPKHWEEATGVADQKKDYVKSKVADKQKDIDLCEASIEFAYNMINVLMYQLEFCDE